MMCGHRYDAGLTACPDCGSQFSATAESEQEEPPAEADSHPKGEARVRLKRPGCLHSYCVFLIAIGAIWVIGGIVAGMLSGEKPRAIDAYAFSALVVMTGLAVAMLLGKNWARWSFLAVCAAVTAVALVAGLIARNFVDLLLAGFFSAVAFGVLTTEEADAYFRRRPGQALDNEKVE
jgi:hypothetical protein